MYIGAHVRASGGVWKAIDNGVELGCEAVQFFAGSPRTWKPTLYKDADSAKFREMRAGSPIRFVVIHTIYLINLASENEDFYEKSVTSLSGGRKQPVADTAPTAAATSAAAASRGPLPLEGIGPLDFQLGDCFRDFDPEATQSTIVDCATGHSAQLIAIHLYQAPDAYPGLTALKDKGRETCRNAQLAAAATTYSLLQRNAYPSSSSWDNGDRRVDCYVTADAGNVIMESLVP